MACAPLNCSEAPDSLEANSDISGIGVSVYNWTDCTSPIIQEVVTGFVTTAWATVLFLIVHYTVMLGTPVKIRSFACIHWMVQGIRRILRKTPIPHWAAALETVCTKYAS